MNMKHIQVTKILVENSLFTLKITIKIEALWLQPICLFIKLQEQLFNQILEVRNERMQNIRSYIHGR